MLQKGLEHDQITMSQMGNKATAIEQLDNQTFIHEPMTLNENCRISREESI